MLDFKSATVLETELWSTSFRVPYNIDDRIDPANHSKLTSSHCPIRLTLAFPARASNGVPTAWVDCNDQLQLYPCTKMSAVHTLSNMGRRVGFRFENVV